jgi:hypothetical protein
MQQTTDVKGLTIGTEIVSGKLQPFKATRKFCVIVTVLILL